jgi:hypothetical protein
MRRRSVATAVLSFTVGVAASAVLRRLAGRRPASAVVPAPPVVPAPLPDAVVLPFTRRATATPGAERPAVPARCGDSGGRTKAGAPCGGRATSGGRCHHHPIAA